jgi:hypothetical protein
MKIIISPAKKLNEEKVSIDYSTSIEFPNECEDLINFLSKYSTSEIKDLMKVSDNIAQLNFNRFKKFDFPMDLEKCKPSVHMFDGAVYSALNISDFNQKEMSVLQNRLRILSGLYGVLKPFDMILPYRLEMGTKFKKGLTSLYAFWGDRITNSLKNDIKDECLINLASNEYSKVINLDSFDNVITPIFKDYKNGEFKVISFFAKKARGLFTRFLIKENITKIDELKLFTGGGYSFSEMHDNGNMIFTR